MKKLIVILFLGVLSHSTAQRPDLSIGVSGTLKSFRGLESSLDYFVPGADIHLFLSKRSMIAGVQVGYWTTLANSSNQNFHHLHLDVSAGMMLIRKPAFKLILNLPISTNYSLTSKSILDDQLDFSPFSLLLSPELDVRYKFILIGINYTTPVLGSSIRGPGIRLGCNL